MTTPDIVQAEGLGVVFTAGEVRALRDVGFALRAGEFVSIVGPSGCGKSTLLRLIAGLLTPTEGRLRVAGRDPAQARRAGHATAFVFQQPTLLPWRTVLGNLRLPLELGPGARRRPRPTPAELERVLDLVGLGDFARAYPHQLSGGMQMRASLARALATRPDLLLMDEPFGALDDLTRLRLNEELLALWQRAGWTALFVTHNVAEAVFLSQRIFVMTPRPGRLLAEIAVPFAYPRPAELRATPEFARLCGEVGTALLRADAAAQQDAAATPRAASTPRGAAA